MRIIEYPFIKTPPQGVARPYLPVTMVNPGNGKSLNVYALVDTGADECAFPASFADMLGHNLQAGHEKKIGTGNGVTTAYGHTVCLKVFGFVSENVVIDFMPNLNVPLLGVRSFLSNFVLNIDYPKKSLSLYTPNHAK